MRLSRADRTILAVLGGAVALAALVWGAPRLMLGRATQLAHRCLEAPAGKEDAHCARAEVDLARLAAVAWTKHDATYRYEELRARRALAAYDEATFGYPDPVARARTGAALAIHQEIVEDGSTRLILEDLGAPVGAPDAGRAAMLHGDRVTLLDRWDHVGGWPVRVAALRAALQEGDLVKVDTIAARYAEFDPRDAELRTTVGAALCLGPDPGRGLEILARVPADRAAERHAAIARNWGEVRAVQEVCADLASIEAPPMPIERHAGIPDADELRAVVMLRLAQGAEETREALIEVRDLLTEDPGPEGAGLIPRVDDARAALLAELVLADPALTPQAVAALAAPRSDREPSLAPPVGETSTWVLREARSGAPWVPAASWARASERVESLAGADALPAPIAATLRGVAVAFALHAARGFVGSGEADAAIAQARRASQLAPRGERGDPLIIAEVAAAAGVVATAHAASRPPPGDLVPVAPPPVGPPALAPTPRKGERVAMALADALASAAEVRADDVKSALTRATEAAKAGSTDALDLELALWSLAFSASPPDEGSTAPGALPSWAGFAASATASRAPRVGATTFKALLALTAQPEGAQRRAARRALIDRRGDAPPALLPWVMFLAQLAPENASGDAVEVWLDAALAVDAPRFTLREVAHARAVAARIRRDHENASRWEERLANLRAVYREPRRAVVARFLGL